MRRIGVLMNATADEDQQAIVTAFLQVLQQLGWTDGCNVRIEFRWGEGNAEQYRKIAAELVALAADVIVLSPLARGRGCAATHFPKTCRSYSSMAGRADRPIVWAPSFAEVSQSLYDSCAAGPFRPTLT
jgi:hypothetical protein